MVEHVTNCDISPAGCLLSPREGQITMCFVQMFPV